MEKKHIASAVVLGLNDAIIEITGSLAGLTFALGSSKLIGVSGLVIGIAASLSMMASEFLSEKEDGDTDKEAKYLAGLTGIAYFVTVILLVIPYFIFSNVWTALIFMLLIAIIIIFVYSYKMTKIQKDSFSKRFRNMALISLSVAFISFVIGFILEKMFGVAI